MNPTSPALSAEANLLSATPSFVPELPSLKVGDLQFLWHENWAKTPATSAENGRTHGAAVTADGNLYVFHQATPAVLHFDEHGQLLEEWGDDFPGAHGLTLVEEDGEEYFWLTDEASGLVAKYNRSGEWVQSLEKPAHALYETGRYSPTWVAVNPQNGDVFVADGYGSSLIHLYNRDGEYRLTLTGEEGAGRFNCPHGIWVDTRGETPELLVADRGNKQVQVYDMEGQFLRVFGADVLNSPCCFVTSGEYLIVPELLARLAVFDGNNQFLGYLGDNGATVDVAGWPDHDAALIQAGKFNSPHGIAAGADGSLYIVEWILGGRITKLEKVSP